MSRPQHRDLTEALLNAVDYGVLMSDTSGTDLLCNPAFGELFGIDPEKVGRLAREEMRQLALERVVDPAAFGAYMECVYANPRLELRDDLELAAPRPCILRRHTAPVLDRDGAVLGRLWTFLDITETRRLRCESLQYEARLEQRLAEQAEELQAAQTELLKSAQIHAVGALAVGVAHDIRNILTSMWLEINSCTDADYRIASTAQLDRLYTLTHSLLALREEPPQAEAVVDLAEVIDFAFSLVHGQAEIDGVSLEKRVIGPPPRVRGNPRRLEQLFLNLILNGLNAVAPAGGVVAVSICHEEDAVRVDITDDGPGILLADLPHLYDPFFTTRANRAGMGLFSSRRIVESHNGRISIAGNPGAGACASVWLPAANETDAQLERSSKVLEAVLEETVEGAE